MAKKTTRRNAANKTSASEGGLKVAAVKTGKVAQVAKSVKPFKSVKSVKSAKGAPVGKPGKRGKELAAAKRAAGSVGGQASARAGRGTVLPVSTGRGPSPAEVGRDFVALFNARTSDHEIWDKLFSPDFVSVEGHGVSMAFHGRDAVQTKCDQWLEMSMVHGCACEGPFAGATCFAVKFRIDKTDKATGRRAVDEEIAVYAVQDGRVVREEFCYFIA